MWPTLPPMRHDMFRTGSGLGVVAHDILLVLDIDQGLTARQIAEATHLKVDAVRTKLRRMAEVGMCLRDDARHWRLLPFDPDEVAVLVGTAGKAQRQRERNLAITLIRAAEVEVWRAAHHPPDKPDPTDPPDVATTDISQHHCAEDHPTTVEATVEAEIGRRTIEHAPAALGLRSARSLCPASRAEDRVAGGCPAPTSPPSPRPTRRRPDRT